MSPSQLHSARIRWRVSRFGQTKLRRAIPLGPLRTEESMSKLSQLTVRHVTTYRYREPVRLGEHRMMFRPRASHDLKLLRTSLSILPNPSRLRWLHDVFDNSIAIPEFDGPTSELRFESIVTIEHFETTFPEYPLEEYANSYPFKYSEEDMPSLCRALAHHY